MTAVYNETLKERLPKHKITVTEIPRLKVGGEAVSATKVRTVLADLWRSGKSDCGGGGESSALSCSAGNYFRIFEEGRDAFAASRWAC